MGVGMSAAFGGTFPRSVALGKSLGTLTIFGIFHSSMMCLNSGNLSDTAVEPECNGAAPAKTAYVLRRTDE